MSPGPFDFEARYQKHMANQRKEANQKVKDKKFGSGVSVQYGAVWYITRFLGIEFRSLDKAKKFHEAFGKAIAYVEAAQKKRPKGRVV